MPTETIDDLAQVMYEDYCVRLSETNPLRVTLPWDRISRSERARWLESARWESTRVPTEGTQDA